MTRDIRSDPNRSPTSGSDSESNGRTDERTYVEGQDVRLSGSFAERAREASGSTAITLERLLADAGVDRVDVTPEDAEQIATRLTERTMDRGAVSVGQAMSEWLDAIESSYGKRWPVIRTGARERIPNVVRLSIYARDNFTCQRRNFGWHSEQLELDHCIPWSAGGPDDSDNLRTLCSACNSERSNFIDHAHEGRYRPTTWWCLDCWADDAPRPRREWKDGTHIDLIPQIRGEECGPIEHVFCAFCGAYSMSPLFFVGEIGRRLISRVWVPPSHPDRELHANQ